MILLIVSIVLGVFWFGFTIYQILRLNKLSVIGGLKFSFNRELLVKFLLILLAQGIFTISSSYGLVLNNGWHLKAFEHVLLVFGSYFFGTGFLVGVSSFIIRYYNIGVEEKEKRVLKTILLIAAGVFVLGIYLLSTAVADYLTYPLPNGIGFKSGIGTIYPTEEGGILWYGLLIVSGTFLAYLIADHIMYKKYKKHGLLEGVAICGFISGIIGARLWSCLVLEFNYYSQHVGEIFKIWQGGLAIQGGIFLGAAVTVPFIIFHKKELNVRHVIDVVLPCIIIAQAIGRWGNFFNQEVYGKIVSEDVMKIFPKIIVNNMYIEGAYRLPLFFIEGAINIAGFFVLRYAIGRGLKNIIGLGDIGASYVIWYGLTRVVLEPLRDGFTIGTHESGFGYLQSWIVAFIMIGVGILLIVAFHLYDFIRKKKGLPAKTLETI